MEYFVKQRDTSTVVAVLDVGQFDKAISVMDGAGAFVEVYHDNILVADAVLDTSDSDSFRDIHAGPPLTAR